MCKDRICAFMVLYPPIPTEGTFISLSHYSVIKPVNTYHVSNWGCHASVKPNTLSMHPCEGLFRMDLKCICAGPVYTSVQSRKSWYLQKGTFKTTQNTGKSLKSHPTGWWSRDSLTELYLRRQSIQSKLLKSWYFLTQGVYIYSNYNLEYF